MEIPEMHLEGFVDTRGLPFDPPTVGAEFSFNVFTNKSGCQWEAITTLSVQEVEDLGKNVFAIKAGNTVAVINFLDVGID